MPPDIILASSSPRRKELLEKLGIKFKVLPSSIAEIPFEDESPEDFALRLSSEKAAAAAGGLDEGCIVIGADTIVVVDGEILGKPRDEQEAKVMLRKISGREHIVITAFSIIKPKAQILHKELVKTAVQIKTLTAEEIENYVKTGEPMDKSGAYGAQGIGAFMIRELHGSYTNVVGLPLSQLVDALSELGISITK
jgi:septum formation protein